MNAVVRTLKPFGIPDGVDPRTWRQAIEAQLNDLFDRATALITALDVMDADSEDYEEGGDLEPSLGWTERGGQSFLAATAPNGSPCDTVDLELDNCDDEDGHDAEPCPDDHGETVTWENDKSQEVLVSL